MKTWNELTHFAGFDWAGDHHDVVIVDQAGLVVAQFRFAHSAEGWNEFRQKTQAYAPLGVAVETRSGAAVEELLRSDCTVFPVQPKAAARYRERKAPSGVKDDQLDAWALADALRMDGRTWRALAPEDPLIQELRLLCRDEVALIQQRTLLVNQLRAALREYYDAALQAFDDWTLPAAWALIVQFPTPKDLARPANANGKTSSMPTSCGGRRRPKTPGALRPGGRLETQRTGHPCQKPAGRESGENAPNPGTATGGIPDRHRNTVPNPSGSWFVRLPARGGSTLAPRLMSELGSDRTRFDTPQALQCVAGTAPISFQSGQIHRVKMRRCCNLHLRHALHLWADCSRAQCGWAQAYYQDQRGRGKSHACALRCLAHRWLEVLWKMWQTHTRYDGELHARNQQKHGSWVIQILTASPTKPV